MTDLFLIASGATAMLAIIIILGTCKHWHRIGNHGRAIFFILCALTVGLLYLGKAFQ